MNFSMHTTFRFMPLPPFHFLSFSRYCNYSSQSLRGLIQFGSISQVSLPHELLVSSLIPSHHSPTSPFFFLHMPFLFILGVLSYLIALLSASFPVTRTSSMVLLFSIFHFGFFLNHCLSLISSSLILTQTIFLIDWLFLSLALSRLDVPWHIFLNHLNFLISPLYLILSPLISTVRWRFRYYLPLPSVSSLISLWFSFATDMFSFIDVTFPSSLRPLFCVHLPSSPLHAYHVPLTLNFNFNEIVASLFRGNFVLKWEPIVMNVLLSLHRILRQLLDYVL